MRKMLVPLAAAGAALAVSTPASAQFYGGQPYGYGYNNYGQVRAMHQRIDQLEWKINRLDRFNGISDGSAERLRFEARQLEFQLNRAARYGLNPYEANQIQYRIARLAQRVQYASASRYGRYGYRDNGYGYQRYGDYDRGNWNRDRDDDDRDGD